MRSWFFALFVTYWMTRHVGGPLAETCLAGWIWHLGGTSSRIFGFLARLRRRYLHRARVADLGKSHTTHRAGCWPASARGVGAASGPTALGVAGQSSDCP